MKERKNMSRERKKIDVYIFFTFLYSGIPDLALVVWEMLIGVCVRDVLQPSFYHFVPGIIWLSAGWYSKCTIFAVNLCYLQVLAMYKKVIS